MWQVKIFKTKDKMIEWMRSNKSIYQMSIVFVNNSYAVEYRPYVKVY